MGSKVGDALALSALWLLRPHGPSDLVRPMTKMLGGQKFASDTEVQLAVCQWLAVTAASIAFFAEGIQKPVGISV